MGIYIAVIYDKTNYCCQVKSTKLLWSGMVRKITFVVAVAIKQMSTSHR